MKKYIDRIAWDKWPGARGIRAFLQNERGQDLIEYALLAGFVVIAIYVVLPNDLMPAVSTIFSRLASIFASAP